MYQNGVDIRTLQNVLGHTSVNTTMIYTHIEDSSLREAAAKNPLASVRPHTPAGGGQDGGCDQEPENPAATQPVPETIHKNRPAKEGKTASFAGRFVFV